MAVTASADHSLRVWDLSKSSQSRYLFNKNFGHKDWVTCCSFLQDSRILSGGMDGLLCLWDRRAVRCDNLSDHSSSISHLQVDSRNIAISSSYDKTMIVWDLQRLKKINSLEGTAPVITFAWNNSLAVSGERNGAGHFWDINTGQSFFNVQNHTSAVHKICFSADGGDHNIVASCGKDGKIAVNDLRDNRSVFNSLVHRGAVNFIAGTFSNTLVSASADCTVKVLDAYMGYSVRQSISTSSAVLCGNLLANLFVCGCADGNLVVYDLDTGEPMFGFGCENEGGVNCIGFSQNKKKCIVGGDSGVPLLLNF